MSPFFLPSALVFSTCVLRHTISVPTLSSSPSPPYSQIANRKRRHCDCTACNLCTFNSHCHLCQLSSWFRAPTGLGLSRHPRSASHCGCRDRDTQREASKQSYRCHLDSYSEIHWTKLFAPGCFGSSGESVWFQFTAPSLRSKHLTGCQLVITSSLRSPSAFAPSNCSTYPVS